MVWLGCFFLAFGVGIGLFFVSLLLFRTRIAAGVDFGRSATKVTVDAALLHRMLKIQFRFSGKEKQIAVMLARRSIFQKRIASPEKQITSEENRPKKLNQKKKKLHFRKRVGAVQSYWKVLQVFLHRFFTSLHAFRLRGNLRVGFGSPAQTGVFLGVWHALRGWLPQQHLVLQPDFLEKKAEGWMATELEVRLIRVLWAGIPFYWGLRKINRSRSV